MQLRGDRNQCTGCGLYFNSSHAFEKHRVGDHGVNRRCLNPDEMLSKGMVLGADGFWRGSAMPQQVLAEKAVPGPLHQSLPSPHSVSSSPRGDGFASELHGSGALSFFG